MIYFSEKTTDLLKAMKIMNPTAIMEQRYEAASDEEKAKIDDIRKNVRIFIEKKDFNSAIKYLNHLK